MRNSILEINSVEINDKYIKGFLSFSGTNNLIRIKMPNLKTTERFIAKKLSVEIISGYFVVAYRLTSISNKIKIHMVMKLDLDRGNFFPDSFNCLIAGDYIQITEDGFSPTTSVKNGQANTPEDDYAKKRND